MSSLTVTTARCRAGALRGPHPPAGPVRLTARGRALVVVVAALPLLALGSLLARQPGDAAPDAGPGPAVSWVTVAPGETLWQIAGRVAPGVDRRDTVDRILELNGLRAGDLRAGQRLAVPVQR